MSRRGSSMSSSHAGSPFDAFQWERDPIKYQEEVRAYQTERARQRAQETRRRQGGQQCTLSERLALGDQLPMAHLLTPSPILTPAGVGRNTSRGSWELTPPPNVLDGLDVDIDQEGQAILEELLPTTSRVTPSPTSARELAARRDLMIRGLANGCINQALRPHLQREYHISDQDIAETAANGRGRSTTPWCRPPGGSGRGGCGGGGAGPPPPPPSSSPSPAPSGTPHTHESSGS